MLRTFVLTSVVGLGTLAAAPVAEAGDCHHHHHHGGYPRGVGYGYPGYPRPVPAYGYGYVAPRPVYVPAPVYQPVPVPYGGYYGPSSGIGFSNRNFSVYLGR